MWNPLKRWFASPGAAELEQRKAELLQQAPIPEIWLLGKTGSGKSSIIRFLTGVERVEIGNGFRPQTMYSQRYSFPDEETPLIRFWDTRGLGEARYEEASDLQELDRKVHLLLVVVRAMDHATDQIVRPLREIRRRNPKRPVLLVFTALHDAYPGQQHPDPDPFEAATENQVIPQTLDSQLQRSLLAQLERFDGLYDQFVAVDLTPEDEGFAQSDYGGERLKRAILDWLPQAYQQTMVQLDQMLNDLGKLHWQKCAPVILAHSALAASAAAIPVPWIDIPAILAIQSNLARKLAKLNQQELDAATWAKVGGAIGGGQVAVQMGVREMLKVVPWVGMAVNSASSFAMTYAIGSAWNWYFMQRKWGHLPTTAEIKQQYQEQLKRGASLWASSTKEAE